MKALCTLLLSLISCSVIAQVGGPALLWLSGYGGDKDDQVGAPVTKTQDGGFIIVFDSNSDSATGDIDSFCNISGGRTIFLKYNADASILEWSKCYGYDGDTGLAYMFPTNNGGTVLGGQYTSAEGWGFYICKQDAMGNIVWSHGYSKGMGPLLGNMVATDDGGYLMSGQCYYVDTNTTTHYGSSMSADIWILKLDSLGNKVWSRVIGGSEQENVFSIILAPDGGCYIAGTTQSSDYDCTGYHGGGQDLYLARLDSNGNLLWHRDLGGSGLDGNWGWGTSDGNGGVLIACGSTSTDGDEHHHIGGYDYWALDVDSNSNILWENCYGGPAGNESATAICKAADGSIWINGISGTPSGEVDTMYGLSGAWVVHTDSAGNFLSGKVLGGEGTNWGQMIYPLTGGLVIAGGYYTIAGGLFSSLMAYGSFPTSDAFICVLAPWPESVQQINTTNSSVKIYPNPATDEVQVSVTSLVNEYCTISINNLVGNQIYSGTIQKNNDNITIDTKDWAKGIYIVQVISENGLKTVKKLLVE